MPVQDRGQERQTFWLHLCARVAVATAAGSHIPFWESFESLEGFLCLGEEFRLLRRVQTVSVSFDVCDEHAAREVAI